MGSNVWGLREVKSSSGLKDHYLDDTCFCIKPCD